MSTLKNRWVFVDDIINGHRPHALQLFRALKGQGLKWAAQATVMVARDEELLDAAVEAGCRGLFIGFETFSSPNLKKLGKPVQRHVVARPRQHGKRQGCTLGQRNHSALQLAAVTGRKLPARESRVPSVLFA